MDAPRMLSEGDLGVARMVKQALIAAGVPLVRMLVFGSRARGDNDPDSDLDVCLVLRECDPAIESKIDDVVGDVGFEADRLIATVEFCECELEGSPLRASPLVRSVLVEGIAV